MQQSEKKVPFISAIVKSMAIANNYNEKQSQNFIF